MITRAHQATGKRRRPAASGQSTSLLCRAAARLLRALRAATELVLRAAALGVGGGSQRVVMADMHFDSDDHSLDSSAAESSGVEDDDSDMPTMHLLAASAAVAASASQKSPAAKEDADYPRSWREHQCPHTKRPFYHNTSTGTKAWELPNGVVAVRQRDNKRAAQSPPPARATRGSTRRCTGQNQ